jgi:hypothetical protein
VYYAEGVKINLRDMKKLVLSIGVVFATTFTVFSQRPSNAISFVGDFDGSGRFIKNICAYNRKLSLQRIDTMKVNTIPTNVVSDCFFSDSIIIDTNFALQAMVASAFGIDIATLDADLDPNLSDRINELRTTTDVDANNVVAYVYADMMFEDLLSRRGDEFKEILSSRKAQGNNYSVSCTNVIIKNPKAEGNLNYYLFKFWNKK